MRIMPKQKTQENKRVTHESAQRTRYHFTRTHYPRQLRASLRRDKTRQAEVRRPRAEGERALFQYANSR